jgi:sulfate permease, SulP family
MKKATKVRIIRNWKSGLTVALVSIPLSLALAIASGATPVQGIITAFWAGLLGAYFGGSNYNIIGPTGALSGILLGYAITYGHQTLPIVALISGIMILAVYILKLDRYIIFIPRSVVTGFTLGVAFIIAFGQLDNMLGIAGVEKKGTFLENMLAVLSRISETDIAVFIAFVLSTSLILFWDKKVKKLPGSIIIAFLGILTVFILQLLKIELPFAILSDKYSDIKAAIFENPFANVGFGTFFNKQIWVISVGVTVVGVLETLLSGQIAKDMTKEKFDRRKEVFGLSLANMASGLAGGIPATAALARTALNIKSGANHRTSGVISSVFVGIITLFLFSYFKLLPMAVIAAILFVVALRMIEFKHFIVLISNARTSFLISLLVAIITIAEDPIAGLVVGSVVALIIFVNEMSQGQTEILYWKNGKVLKSVMRSDLMTKGMPDSEFVVYKLSGTMTYINMPAHIETAKLIKGNKHVVISLSHAFYADLDGIEYLKELIETLKSKNEKIYLSGINPEIKKAIMNEDFYKQKLVDNRIFTRVSEAIDILYKDHRHNKI